MLYETSTIFYLAIILFAFSFSQCKKDKNEEPQLPPETTIGAMTFGCKVNGKVFVPKDGRGRVGLFVQYVNLGDGPNGGWFLNIPATNWQSNPPDGISIQSDSLLVKENGIYQFQLSSTYQRVKGSVNAVIDFKGKTYAKLGTDNGELHITKHDQQNRILSGTFFFIGTNISTGEKVSITEGRFDIRY